MSSLIELGSLKVILRFLSLPKKQLERSKCLFVSHTIVGGKIKKLIDPHWKVNGQWSLVITSDGQLTVNRCQKQVTKLCLAT